MLPWLLVLHSNPTKATGGRALSSHVFRHFVVPGHDDQKNLDTAARTIVRDQKPTKMEEAKNQMSIFINLAKGHLGWLSTRGSLIESELQCPSSRY